MILQLSLSRSLLLYSFIFISIVSSYMPTNKSLYEKVYAKYPGDIYIGGLFSIHHRLETNGTVCGSLIEQDGLQVLAAAIYGIELINNMSILPVQLGLLAIDTCQNTDYVIDQSMEFMQFKMSNVETRYTCPNQGIPTPNEELKSFQNIFGVFGAGNSDVSMATSTYLKLIKLPQLSYFSTSPKFSDETTFPWFFRTIPSDEYSIKAIVELLKRLRWNYVLILNDESDYSKHVTQMFISQINSKIDFSICVAKIMKITKTSAIKDIVVDILEKANDTSVRVIVTFLAQPFAEDFLEYIESLTDSRLDTLMWIATDSWGGRNWPKMRNATSNLKNIIAVIPNAHFNPAFMDYYTSRLPSVIDSDPWLAERFEEACHCQYTTRDLFIFLELQKIRISISNVTSCESIELECSRTIYQELEQMMYIHYVIDGIFAYAYTVQKLIPDGCWGMDKNECIDLLWKSGALNIPRITDQMKLVQFIDSTGQEFKFWNGRDGIPKYSVVYFNTTKMVWTIVGNISENAQIDVDKSFYAHVKAFKISPCSRRCLPEQARRYNENKCCWKCQTCLFNSIIVTKNSSLFNIVTNANQFVMQQECVQCNQTELVQNRTCVRKEISSMTFSEPIALTLLILNMLGLLGGLISGVIMGLYWKTPVIKAFGRETSTILLFGTILSFVFSIILLDKPNYIFCILRWCSPGFCGTVCYASILTKTNRIARIFGIKFSSKKNTTPRFISPISQINIVLIITGIECAILTVVMIPANVNTTINNSSLTLNCLNIDPSSLLAIFFIPFLLLLCSTVYAYKIRKTPDGFNETRNINFINFANCVVLVTCLLLYQILKDELYSVLPLALLLTLGGHGNMLGLFFPKIYIIIFRPSKNTIQAITTKSRSRSQLSFSQSQSHSPSISSGLDSQNSRLSTARCRNCNLPLITSIELVTLPRDKVRDDRLKGKSKSKVNFASTPSYEDSNYVVFGDSGNVSNNQVDDKNFVDTM